MLSYAPVAPLSLHSIAKSGTVSLVRHCSTLTAASNSNRRFPLRSVLEARASTLPTQSPAPHARSAIHRSLPGFINGSGSRFAAVSSHEKLEDEFELHKELFDELGIKKENSGVCNGEWGGSGPVIYSMNPSTGKILASITTASKADVDSAIDAARKAQHLWRSVPTPVRGHIVREIGEALREKKLALAKLISLEVGKILAEAEGEVQEFIDMTDIALGLSRSMPGQVLPSERSKHLILEQWHPLGCVGVITAFNFPHAVYGWNSSLAFVCGNSVVWKPALSTSLVALATTKIVHSVLERNNYPTSLAALLCGAGEVGEAVSKDRRVDLVSFTGSTAIGRKVGVWAQERFGRVLLELGGNNACIVMDDANIELAVRGILFSAVGTSGQRCTTTRRLFVQQGVYDIFMEHLTHAYKQVRIGNPLDKGTIYGPLHNHSAVSRFQKTMEEIKRAGGAILHGGKVVDGPGLFVQPTIVRMDPTAEIVQRETFAPILYAAKFKDLSEAIQLNNAVPQGLSSSIFTSDVRALFEFIGPNGSDCGIVNVNVPTSGAEVGAAFGGEKETGGGREAGSDAWKQYCRRSTTTINFGDDLPLAQGIAFHHSPPTSAFDAASASGEVDKLGYAVGGGGEDVVKGGITKAASGGVGGSAGTV
ncbi:Aldedh-domain-containing protein [Gonapodya prolifera JEL478]|uniref:aldehyde dehydrogenase (NAD(+)) n=1 Tax=Gonapodya prolifera (strain JEL478) TaxID=1344416 RepID=A0A139A5H1_GONPJ|nr:Aldedh-domain-containing protein [Gonapodya prolifera JEL478]|eukprot:KXS12040.1 Aldedh-domain-containing protein [Gonapodya prolifera JEL478]